VSNLPPTSKEFRAALKAALAGAGSRDEPFVDVRSGDLHRAVGAYPGATTGCQFAAG